MYRTITLPIMPDGAISCCRQKYLEATDASHRNVQQDVGQAAARVGYRQLCLR